MRTHSKTPWSIVIHQGNKGDRRKTRKLGQNLRTIVLDQENWNSNDLLFDETTTTNSTPAEFSAQFGVPAFCKDTDKYSVSEGPSRILGENPRSHVKAEWLMLSYRKDIYEEHICHMEEEFGFVCMFQKK